MASGISAGMIRALNITADNIALLGDESPIMLSLFTCGRATAKTAGIIAKYLATSFTMLNVVMAPRVIRSCFPIETTGISFDGSLSRSTMFAASLAACVPLFIASPTSACANAGASLVPSPVIATSLPSACSLPTMSILSSGLLSGT